MENQIPESSQGTSMSENGNISSARNEAILSELMRFYSVMGNRPDEPGALSLMAGMLAQSATDDQISAALSRCARECRFPVRIPDILQRIPGQEIPDPEAEARAAWDKAQQFAKRNVYSSPVDGNAVCIDDCHKHDCTLQYSHKLDEHLPERVRDSVRRSGGWRAIALSVKASDPFLKKEFMSEFQAWRAVERASGRNLLSEDMRAQFKQLLEAKQLQ